MISLHCHHHRTDMIARPETLLRAWSEEQDAFPHKKLLLLVTLLESMATSTTIEHESWACLEMLLQDSQCSLKESFGQSQEITNLLIEVFENSLNCSNPSTLEIQLRCCSRWLTSSVFNQNVPARIPVRLLVFHVLNCAEIPEAQYDATLQSCLKLCERELLSCDAGGRLSLVYGALARPLTRSLCSRPSAALSAFLCAVITLSRKDLHNLLAGKEVAWLNTIKSAVQGMSVRHRCVFYRLFLSAVNDRSPELLYYSFKLFVYEFNCKAVALHVNAPTRRASIAVEPGELAELLGVVDDLTSSVPMNWNRYFNLVYDDILMKRDLQSLSFLALLRILVIADVPLAEKGMLTVQNCLESSVDDANAANLLLCVAEKYASQRKMATLFDCLINFSTKSRSLHLVPMLRGMLEKQLVVLPAAERLSLWRKFAAKLQSYEGEDSSMTVYLLFTCFLRLCPLLELAVSSSAEVAILLKLTNRGLAQRAKRVYFCRDEPPDVPAAFLDLLLAVAQLSFHVRCYSPSSFDLPQISPAESSSACQILYPHLGGPVLEKLKDLERSPEKNCQKWLLQSHMLSFQFLSTITSPGQDAPMHDCINSILQLAHLWALNLQKEDDPTNWEKLAEFVVVMYPWMSIQHIKHFAQIFFCVVSSECSPRQSFFLTCYEQKVFTKHQLQQEILTQFIVGLMTYVKQNGASKARKYADKILNAPGRSREAKFLLKLCLLPWESYPLPVFERSMMCLLRFPVKSWSVEDIPSVGALFYLSLRVVGESCAAKLAKYLSGYRFHDARIQRFVSSSAFIKTYLPLLAGGALGSEADVMISRILKAISDSPDSEPRWGEVIEICCSLKEGRCCLLKLALPILLKMSNKEASSIFHNILNDLVQNFLENISNKTISYAEILSLEKILAVRASLKPSIEEKLQLVLRNVNNKVFSLTASDAKLKLQLLYFCLHFLPQDSPLEMSDFLGKCWKIVFDFLQLKGAGVDNIICELTKMSSDQLFLDSLKEAHRRMVSLESSIDISYFWCCVASVSSLDHRKTMLARKEVKMFLEVLQCWLVHGSQTSSQSADLIHCLAVLSPRLLDKSTGSSVLTLLSQVDLKNYPSEDFPHSFKKFHAILWNIIEDKTCLKHNINAVLSCFNGWLEAIIHQGSIDYMQKLSGEKQDEVLVCALLPERFIVLLIKSPHFKARYYPIFIANFVHSYQEAPMFASVKKRIVAALFRLIEASEESITKEVLEYHLNSLDSEVFKSLYSDYKKNFQYSGSI